MWLIALSVLFRQHKSPRQHTRQMWTTRTHTAQVDSAGLQSSVFKDGRTSRSSVTATTSSDRENVTAQEEVSSASVESIAGTTVANDPSVVADAYLCDLQEPTTLSPANAAALLAGPRLTPKKHIWFYSPDEWEEFILEWASMLPGYVAVKRFGGANDRGIDVAGLLSKFGLEGSWDCYQCKHYNRPLEPGDARAEVLKIFCGVAGGYYKMPRKYRILAPQGCGPGLSRLLSAPSKLKADFIANLDPARPACRDIDGGLLDRVKDLASGTDFSIFGCEDLDEVIELHRRSPNHLVRFGGQLPSRQQSDAPPSDPAQHETRYIEQLMEVYDERFPGSEFNPSVAASNSETSEHYLRQREAFYSAEALRVFARDSVPEGTFANLQEEVFDGVIESCDWPHNNGYERLSSVLSTAGSLAITANALIAVTEQRDRKGICHQLANEDRLIWVRGRIS